MEGFEIRFKVYANSQAEADAATDALKAFVNDMARRGIAVTAQKLTDAVSRWKDNVFVSNYFNR